MLWQDTVLRLFNEINQIPRCSGEEKAISDWLYAFGRNNGFEVIQDKSNNIIIKVPGKKDLTNKPPVILQGHMDMVCVKDPTSAHNFQTDPIRVFDKDGWLQAKETTLGADNGISLAIALAISIDKDISHPPLELLFTVDEERGLTGAKTLEPDVLESKYLINLDSEDEGVITIGCAGGRDTHIKLPLTYQKATSGLSAYKIHINKLNGGHSGIQIGQKKANSIQMISRILYSFNLNLSEFYISDLFGGIAHNAIPTDVTLKFATNDEKKAQNIVEGMFTTFEKEYRSSETNMTLSLEKIDVEEFYVTHSISHNIAMLLTALPHGVLTYGSVECRSLSPKQIIETSNNLAQIEINNETLHILISQRSNVASQLDFITNKIESIAALAGAKFFTGTGYPPWQPEWQSELLLTTIAAYKKLFQKEPKIEVIHAGLECGVIGSKYPEMQMVSIGPTIKSPHTTSERLNISDITKIYSFLIELLINL